MLCQFTVKNYKSIREEMTFDMQAAWFDPDSRTQQYLVSHGEYNGTLPH